MNNGLLPMLPGAAPAPRRGPGRPKGSRNKRSEDLARYIEAQYQGLTPGQQGAAISMVDARELREAKGDLVVAMAAKAIRLARLLGCEAKEAWLLMQKERADLLPYVHQKRPPKAEEDGKERPPVTWVAVPVEEMEHGAGGAEAGEWDTPPDLLENQQVIDGEAGEVTQPKSQDAD